MEESAIRSLQDFIRTLVAAGVTDRDAYRIWRKQNEAALEKFFLYERCAGMPKMSSLVRPFFHPTKPLIGLNYTQVAHNVLFRFPEGWTLPLRLCRGIIFDREGNLAAKPFPKFFNFGEMGESSRLPDEPFDATQKYDGHLGIVFKYRGKFFVTTRGDFKSRTSVLAAKMLRQYVKENNWRKVFPEGMTVLAEVIHPETRVHIAYRRRGFVLIGAYRNAELKDLNYEELKILGRQLNLPVTERWRGNSLDDLRKLMADLSVRGKEGYVVRFQCGLRIKFKFASYINKMVEGKISYQYLMRRVMNGNLEKMIGNLPEEVLMRTREMVREMEDIRNSELPEKEKWQRMYSLVPADKSTANYRSVCRAFLRSTRPA